MAITDLWNPARSRRHAQRSNKLRERMGRQLLAAGRDRLPMLARSSSQSKRSAMSISVTYYVQFYIILKR